MLLFCLLGTIIDLVYEEWREVLAGRELPQSSDGMVEHVELPSSEDNQYPKNQSVENISRTSSDVHPLLVSNGTPTPSGISCGLFQIFYLVLGKLMPNRFMCYQFLCAMYFQRN